MHEDARPIQILAQRATIAMAVAFCAFAALADSTQVETSQAAAELLASGKHAEAIAAYDALIQNAGQSSPIELRLGRAAALAVLQPGEGEAELREVLASASRSEVRAAAAFHLGLLEARRAEPAPNAPTGGSTGNAATPTPSESDAETAIKTLKRAERFFRMSSALHAGDGAAAMNVDLVQRRIAAIQEQERQRQEQEKQQQNKQQSQQGDKSQQSDQPNPSETGDPKPDQQQGEDQQSKNNNGSLSDQLKNLADQQQRAADETAKQQPSADQQAAAQKAAENAQKQRELSDKTREAREKAKSQADASKGEQKREELDKAKQKLDEAQKAQGQAEQQLKDGKQEEAVKSQQQAADALRQAQQHAAAEEAAKQQEKDQQKAEQEAKEQQQQQAQQSQRPYDATAAQILDRERWLREQLRRVQAQMRSRAAPVEKDW